MFPSGSSPASPTLLAVAQAQTAKGVMESLAGDPHQGLPLLIHASDMMNASGATVPLPGYPGALAALVALHSGEPHLAETIVRAAVAAGQGGDAAKPRLFLLQAWSAMQQDNPEDARLAINEASKANHWPLVPRDEFLCSALEVGLARRSGEVHDLVLAWERAREAMLHTSVDLYSLLPWGELMITAARLRETRRVSHYLDEAWKLLHRLGDPPLWAVPLHWAGSPGGAAEREPGRPGTACHCIGPGGRPQPPRVGARRRGQGLGLGPCGTFPGRRRGGCRPRPERRRNALGRCAACRARRRPRRRAQGHGAPVVLRPGPSSAGKLGRHGRVRTVGAAQRSRRGPATAACRRTAPD